MICIETVIKYCKDYQLIENYSDAVNDETQCWDCHHRLETDAGKSMKQLISEGLYYDVSPSELIFMTRFEHLSLHKKGKQLSADHKRKMSENHKGGSPKKQVQCVETGEVFESLTEVSKHYKLSCAHLSDCCNGKRNTTGGLHWKWYNN